MTNSDDFARVEKYVDDLWACFIEKEPIRTRFFDKRVAEYFTEKINTAHKIAIKKSEEELRAKLKADGWKSPDESQKLRAALDTAEKWRKDCIDLLLRANTARWGVQVQHGNDDPIITMESSNYEYALKSAAQRGAKVVPLNEIAVFILQALDKIREVIM